MKKCILFVELSTMWRGEVIIECHGGNAHLHKNVRKEILCKKNQITSLLKIMIANPKRSTCISLPYPTCVNGQKLAVCGTMDKIVIRSSTNCIEAIFLLQPLIKKTFLDLKRVLIRSLFYSINAKCHNLPWP